MPTYSRGAILKKAHLGLNLLSFCFNWDNYALLPVLYPRVTSPHFANSTPEVYGWVGASFAIAAVFGSLLFGAWADKRGAREPLFVGQFIMIIGDVMTYLRLNAWWNILGGRIISGFASGSRTCCLWYLAKTTTGEERGQTIGNFYAAGMLGMVFAPAMAAISGVFPTPEKGSIYSVNAYNAPVLSTLLVHFVAVFIVYRYVYDQPKDLASVPLKNTAVVAEEAHSFDYSGDGGELDIVDQQASLSSEHSVTGDITVASNVGAPCGAFILVACQYLMLTGISSFETFVVPLFSNRFNAPSWVSGLVFAGIGLVVLVSAITGGMLTPQLSWSDRCVEMTGIIIFIIGCLLSYDWSTIVPSLGTSENIALEATSTVLIGIGFTLAFTTQPSLFSKLIMKHRNGVLAPKMGFYMSWLSMASSAAKISGPLVVGYGLVASKDSSRAINILVSVVVGFAILSALLFMCGWKNLHVPDHDELQRDSLDDARADSLRSTSLRSKSISRCRGSSSYQ
jgi:MFS family permease